MSCYSHLATVSMGELHDILDDHVSNGPPTMGFSPSNLADPEEAKWDDRLWAINMAIHNRIVVETGQGSIRHYYRVKYDGRVGRQLGDVDVTGWVCLGFQGERIGTWFSPDDLELADPQ